MFDWLRVWWRQWILRQFYKYYVVGGHCGLCGEWCPNAVCLKSWAITICGKCLKEYGRE